MGILETCENWPPGLLDSVLRAVNDALGGDLPPSGSILISHPAFGTCSIPIFGYYYGPAL